jgi:hypothetical protein
LRNLPRKDLEGDRIGEVEIPLVKDVLGGAVGARNRNIPAARKDTRAMVSTPGADSSAGKAASPKKLVPPPVSVFA